MINKLKEIKKHYGEIESLLALPETVADYELYKKLMKEYKEMTPVIEKYSEYESVDAEMSEVSQMTESEEDPEIKAMAVEEYYALREKSEKILEEIKVLLLPKDPNDEKNVVMEIRAGTGGEEAALFAGVLFRMYTMYAESHRFKIDVMSENETELGGYKEITFTISGKGAYSRLKYESGVHRVQRIPQTESNGKIQTSAATVAVLPEAEDIEIEINPDDLEIESCKSSGAGGQHINKTESAIRILHKPTGIVVFCQTERSQLQNKEYALRLLKARLYDNAQREQSDKIAGERRSQVGSGDRSERIRTYNFPQGRITDHRIGLTLYNLDSFVNGNIDEVIDALATADTAEKLKGGESD